ncbi:MAG: adenylate cyclase regulatory domain-containing protein [Vicinamibacteria bacterium]
MGAIDFQAEGLLDGLEGEPRAARAKLLAELAEDGVELDELRTAVAEDRLALLPVERILSGGGEPLTAAEVAGRAGVEPEFLKRDWRALGMALAEDDAAAYTEQDVEAAKRVQELLDAGVAEEGVLEVARLLGMTMSQLAAANRRLIADAFMHEGDTEYDVAKRFAAATRAFMPLIGETLSYVLALHLREQIRHDAFGLAELSAGRASPADQATICFADMVDFTQLGETLEPEALGTVTGRLGELAAAAVEPPVRLVKMIGDAAMMVGPEPAPVVEAALGLVESAAAEGDEFPLLRAGLASGRALPRAGDWYGRPVNLASRVTGVARPGSVLATEDVREGLADSYAWSYAGERRLKGIDDRVKLFRCRRVDAGAAQ